MKKLILFICLIFLSITSASAKSIKVEAMSDFTTANPPETWKVKVVESVTTKKGFQIIEGSVVEGRIDNLVNPKRLKRNAKFVFVPIKYYDASDGRVYPIEQNFKGKYSPNTDTSIKSAAKSGAVMIGNHFADGLFGPGVALVEGAVKNQEGNRAKSMAKSVYKALPISYIDKGNEIVITQGQIFVINFKSAKEYEQEELSEDNN